MHVSAGMFTAKMLIFIFFCNILSVFAQIEPQHCKATTISKTITRTKTVMKTVTLRSAVTPLATSLSTQKLKTVTKTVSGAAVTKTVSLSGSPITVRPCIID
jgi:hypothetical protein